MRIAATSLWRRRVKGQNFLKASQDSSPEQGNIPNRESANARKHFGLSGPSIVLDRRVNAVRGDIADVALAGVLFAPHYARPMLRRCAVPVAAVRAKANDDAECVSELLHGESFHVVDLSGGWAWGFCGHDHYVGYVRADALAVAEAGHWRVQSASAALRSGATADAETLGTLPMGAIVSGRADGDHLLTDEGVIALADLIAVNGRLDPAAQAEKLLGAPYQRGGRHHAGIDCSGLVQLAQSFAGIAAQRDSDLQEASLGDALPANTPLQRGDVVFFPGHVGMMVDADRVIHASTHSMSVAIEPLADLKARLITDDTVSMKAIRP